MSNGGTFAACWKRTALAAAAAAALCAGAAAETNEAAIFAAIRSNDLARFTAVLEQQGSAAVQSALLYDVTPLHLAAALNRVEMARRLLEQGAAVDARTSGGFTPLHWAASRDAAECAKLLLDAGAAVAARTPNGITPLHWAARRNAAGVAALLLAAGAPPDAQAREGLTPLHWAVQHNGQETAELIAYRIVSAEVDREQTAAEAREAQRDAEMTDLLRDTAAEVRRAAPAEEDQEVVTAGAPPAAPPPGPPPAPGQALKVPLGFRETLEFVWIEALKLWMGKYEVTNGQYRRFDPRHSSLFRESFTLDANDQPVVRVSWQDAQRYSAWLNKNYAAAIPKGWVFRLPTEDEWEYAARCGDRRVYPWGNAWPPPYGNFSDLAARRSLSDWSGIRGYDDGFPVTCPVALSGANEWGLYGLAGNVWEWCADWYDASRKYKVRRGGSWDFDTQEALRVDARGFDRPDAAYDTIGFRLVIARPDGIR